jgi:thioredoxin-related protein
MLLRLTVRTALAGLLLALSTSCSDAELADDAATRDPREYFFTQTFGDLREEMRSARDAGKLGMLLFFEADACPYCQRMLNTIFNQAHVQGWYQERFVSIAVDIHGDVELTDFDGITLPSKVFSDHREVFLTPVVAFLDLSGAEVYRHLGMIKTPEEFLLLGEYVAGEHHFDTEYEVFFREQRHRERGEILTTPQSLSDQTRNNQVE